jgi:hypothetical protein
VAPAWKDDRHDPEPIHYPRPDDVLADLRARCDRGRRGARRGRRECPDSPDLQIREAIAGNLYRGTGHKNIVTAVPAAAQSLAAATRS